MTTIRRFKNIVSKSAAAAIFILAGMACNSKEVETDEIVVTSANVAVKEFHLNSQNSVLANLDSVFFSIDLDHGVIYNADSLPKGTDVSHLLATINFANSMTKVDLVFTNSSLNDTTVNYLTNSTDTIDFTHPVKMNVTAADETTSFTYTIKVNVHNQEPDSLMWDKLAVTSLPSRAEKPLSQKTIFVNEKALSLIEENNGSFTLALSDNLNKGIWMKEEITFPFSPVIDSFTGSESGFWMLADNGELFESADAYEWNSTGEKWISILGCYMGGVLGVKDSETALMHASYPESLGLKETPIEAGFPVMGSSPMAIIESEWYPKPTAFIMGGKNEGGHAISDVWAFDGSDWATINTDHLPPLSRPMMAHYVIYKETTSLFHYRAFDAWLLMGGLNDDNEFNRKLYISLDNGVTWSMAPELMQLPETFPSLIGADMIVAGHDLTADLSDAWETVASKSAGRWLKPSYTLDGYDITWECPYLYIFGGYDVDDILSDTIWRGVLTRLTFTPII